MTEFAGGTIECFAGPREKDAPDDLEAVIVEFIEELIETGHAYEVEGDVYFRVRSFDDYGKLSNRDPEEMDQGEEAGSAEPQPEAAARAAPAT